MAADEASFDSVMRTVVPALGGGASGFAGMHSKRRSLLTQLERLSRGPGRAEAELDARTLPYETAHQPPFNQVTPTGNLHTGNFGY